MAKSVKRNKPSLGQEMVAVLMVVSGLFLLLSLISFSQPVGHGQIGVSNWGGRVGHNLSTVLMSFLGVGSIWLPLLLLFFSIGIFSFQSPLQRLPFICSGYSGILISTSSLLASFGENFISFFGKSYPLGGWLGDFLYRHMASWFGGVGAVLFFLALFLCSLMAAVRFSPYFWGGRMVAGYGVLSEKMKKNREIKRQNTATVADRNAKSLALKKETDESLLVPNVHIPIKPTNEIEEDFQPVPMSSGEYQIPPVTLLEKSKSIDFTIDRDHYFEISKQLELKLADFGVKGKVTGISPGPVITTYEFAPAPGIKITKVVSLVDDLTMGLKKESVRIAGSIPGKAALGIEIPNLERQIVSLRDILASEKFIGANSKLTMGLGMDVVGNPILADLARMPHLLIAGATGAGKSVAINCIICSILLKATPDEVRLLLIDPKRIELSTYEEIPHLLHPVVVDPKMASRALQWAVREMERRYELMEELRVKSFYSYNEIADEKFSLIVIIIDELADLMMVSSSEVETSVARLAQMARAAGMHLILATQRPSVDVLTGLIKANFPTRMSFKVSSKIDSRTILDSSGAEHLLGAGDMLFLPPGSARLQRIHGAFISEKETKQIVQFLKEQGSASYDESVLKIVEESGEESSESLDGDYDEKYDEAVALVCELGQASISMVQRRFRVGYNRAARMIETMEREGIVGPADGSKPREVLVKKSY
ncbi:MAG: DNA translocase FtsK 4TM domain-containing protein [Thermodesulfobacteriota bacterium]|nr:DNA translocase FtsK 4TM domain-containing protein [Thermodesulfobacteriota bacterium]